MKKNIWKYTLAGDCIDVEMPKGAEILTVGAQNEFICLWALVDPSQKKETRTFETFGTGRAISYDMGVERTYLGTCKLMNESLVFHTFERIN